MPGTGSCDDTPRSPGATSRPGPQRPCAACPDRRTACAPARERFAVSCCRIRQKQGVSAIGLWPRDPASSHPAASRTVARPRVCGGVDLTRGRTGCRARRRHHARQMGWRTLAFEPALDFGHILPQPGWSIGHVNAQGAIDGLVTDARSASRAMVCFSRALQPAPGITANPGRSATSAPFSFAGACQLAMATLAPRPAAASLAWRAS